VGVHGAAVVSDRSLREYHKPPRTAKKWSGERGVPAVSAGRHTTREELAAEEGEKEGKSTRVILARGYPVFNAAQVLGFTPPTLPATQKAQRIERAEAFFAALNADIRHGGDRAYYGPLTDHIQMPPFEAFAGPVTYYSVLAHEAVHLSGAGNRLNRQLDARFGEQARAAEELIAELGLSNEPPPDHAAYLASWLTGDIHRRIEGPGRR